MPRLPTAADLGQPEVPVSQRPISTYRGDIAAQGDAALGQGLMNAGKGADEFGAHVQNVQDRLAFSAATTKFLDSKIKIDDEAQKDQEYTTLPDRYSAALTKATQDASSGIVNPVLRSQFETSLLRYREAGVQSVRALARKRQADADQSWLTDQINTGLDNALRAPDDVTRDGIFATLHSSIDAMASPERGSITQQQAAKLRKSIPEQYAEKRAGMLVGTNPTQAVDLLKPTGKTDTGDPIFAKTNSWIDFLPPDKRVALYQKAILNDAGVSARTTADGILAGANQNFQTQAGKLPGSSSISDAILSQESGGNPNAPTSVDGAVGQSQILPATFARYAKPGEDINNPEDNKAVGQRIVADLEKKYPNDPARVAVAYFSGEGNVAPNGSPTPWVSDKTDGNGKSVSSYVADVTGRLAKPGDSTLAKPTQSLADYYRANYAAIVNQAHEKATSERPNDPRYIDLTVAQVQQRMNAVMTQDRLANEAAEHTIYQAFSGQLTNGVKPTSIEQMIGSSPDVKAAWDRLQESNPQAALAVETRILTANSRVTDHDVKTYGTGFYDLFNRIHAPANDPNRITDATQLYPLVGDQITVAGLDKLKGELAGRGTPEATSVSEMRKSALAYAKHQLSFEQDLGFMKIPDPKGMDAFNVGFTPAFYQAYDAGIKAGKTPFQLLSKDSPDFIVDKLVSSFKRPPAQEMQDRMEAGAATKLSMPKPGDVYKGYRFKGGNPSDKNNWELAATGPQVPVR